MEPVETAKITSRPIAQFSDDEVSFSGRFAKDVFATIGLSFYRFRVRVAALLVLGLLGRLILLSSANILGYWADSTCTGEGCKPLPSWLVGYNASNYVELLTVILVVGLVANTWFRVAISRTGAQAVSLLYDEVTYRTSRLPMSFFDATPVGRIINRFSSDYAAIFRMAGGPLAEFLCLVFDLVVIVILMVAANFWFLPAIAALVGLNYAAYRKRNPSLRFERREASVVRGPAISHFAETVQGGATIRAYGKESVFSEQFRGLVHKFLRQRMITAFTVNKFSLEMTTITAGVLLFSGLFSLFLLEQNAVSVGEIAVSFTFIVITSTTIQQFFEWLANMEEAVTGVERLDNYLRRDLEPGAKLPATATFDVGQPRERADEGQQKFSYKSHTKGLDVTFDHVSFRYRPDYDDVLKDVSFSIKGGEHFGIVGRTGSGKSSIIQTLFAMYLPYQGRISVGGYEADVGKAGGQQLPLRSFRKMMSSIPQEPVLFRGTLRENLIPVEASSIPREVDERIWDVLKQIRVHRWVEALESPKGRGLDYFIEEKGGNLSTGERQLLCLARAALQNSSVIIMDEATSAIDPLSEELLMESLKVMFKNTTRIVVAHRLTTLTECDRILWLDAGRVRAIDTPDTILTLYRGR